MPRILIPPRRITVASLGALAACAAAAWATSPGAVDARFNPSANTAVNTVAVRSDGKVLMSSADPTRVNVPRSKTTKGPLARTFHREWALLGSNQ